MFVIKQMIQQLLNGLASIYFEKYTRAFLFNFLFRGPYPAVLRVYSSVGTQGLCLVVLRGQHRVVRLNSGW